MKITTRIKYGFGLLMVLLLALAMVEIIAIRRMESINENLARVSQATARDAVQLMRDGYLIEQSARRAIVLGDKDAAAQLKEYQDSFEASLQTIRQQPQTEQQEIEVRRLTRFWEEFARDLAGEIGQTWPRGPAEFPDSLRESLERLQTQMTTVYQTAVRTAETSAEKSRQTARFFELFTWCASALALLAGALASFLIVRSISIPLRHLTEGTRAMVEGKSFYRLDASRDDELSQLAKDFNTVSQRLRGPDKGGKE